MKTAAKKLFAALIVLLTLAFAACGGSKDPNELRKKIAELELKALDIAGGRSTVYDAKIAKLKAELEKIEAETNKKVENSAASGAKESGDF
jgi:hypothetical protein